MVRMQAIGHLGRDAVTNTVNGKTVINFTVAHTEKSRDAQGNPKDKTIWVDCAYWTDRTAVAQYLKKGTQVYVEGQPDVRTYTTQDGRNGASLTMRVGSLQLLGGRSAENAGPSDAGSATTYTPPAAATPGAENMPGIDSGAADDLPF
ncbi:MAG: single-stranded DNA-binding protein [Sediminibacterium sp.]|nr:single-stranded DNA-binding protein [Sediminibacterium sp.]